MPELPEVEGFARYFAQHALHQRIARVDVRDERVLAVRKEQLARALRGREFTSVRRHGKHLFADAGKQWVHFHFGMTGDLAHYRESRDEPRFARVVFDFANGAHLAFEDMRLFGVIDLTPSPEAYIEEHALGIDPIDPSFTLPRFREILAKRRGAVKSLLMSQDVIAGIGNLYADEALYQSSIHPRRAIDRLRDTEIRALHTSIRRILRDVIARRDKGGEWPHRYLAMHREEGDRCPRCGGTVARTVVFGRTTYFCKSHQR